MILGLLKRINDDKVQVINGIKLTNYQIRTLKDLGIKCEKYKDVKKLLDEIDNEIYCHVDSKGIRLDEYYDILDELYWDIKKLNKK